MEEFCIKEGYPTVEEARTLWYDYLKSHPNTCVVKLVHGYGSTGQGGEIKAGILKTLRNLKKNGKIITYIRGEDFHVFYPETIALLGEYPQFKKDVDLGYPNEGVTVVQIR